MPPAACRPFAIRPPGPWLSGSAYGPTWSWSPQGSMPRTEVGKVKRVHEQVDDVDPLA